MRRRRLAVERLESRHLLSVGFEMGAIPGNLVDQHEPVAAWEAVRTSVTQDDLVCVTGSFFLAAELGPVIARRPVRPDESQRWKRR